jgi:hypothetical protein
VAKTPAFLHFLALPGHYDYFKRLGTLTDPCT